MGGDENLSSFNVLLVTSHYFFFLNHKLHVESKRNQHQDGSFNVDQSGITVT